jgi:hypothetical protein
LFLKPSQHKNTDRKKGTTINNNISFQLKKLKGTKLTEKNLKNSMGLNKNKVV